MEQSAFQQLHWIDKNSGFDFSDDSHLIALHGVLGDILLSSNDDDGIADMRSKMAALQDSIFNFLTK